jgi:hypothetical protein
MRTTIISTHSECGDRGDPDPASTVNRQSHRNAEQQAELALGLVPGGHAIDASRADLTIDHVAP